jgi:hypothetical protein
MLDGKLKRLLQPTTHCQYAAASHHFKKTSFQLNMYLKSLAILEKASISLKKSSKIIEIFIKAPHF